VGDKRKRRQARSLRQRSGQAPERPLVPIQFKRRGTTAPPVGRRRVPALPQPGRAAEFRFAALLQAPCGRRLAEAHSVVGCGDGGLIAPELAAGGNNGGLLSRSRAADGEEIVFAGGLTLFGGVLDGDAGPRRGRGNYAANFVSPSAWGPDFMNLLRALVRGIGWR